MKFKLSRDGIQELLTSPAVTADLRRRAERVAAAAMSTYQARPGERNPGYIANAESGVKRARSSVVTGNPHAQRHNAANNTLLRALEAGRD